MRLTLMCAGLLACTPVPDPALQGPGSSNTTIDTDPTPDTDTDATPDTDDTDTDSGPTITYDCSLPWPTSLGPTLIGPVPASEDFDIDADGDLIHVENSNLVVRSSVDNSVTVIAGNLTWSASGTRVLRNGDIVVADSANGNVVRVDRQTGAKVTLINRNWPNGIDVDADDNVYVSDFADIGSVTRINAYDPADNEILLANVARPNGVALSPDGNTLYIAANWSDEIWALEKDGNGDWGPPSMFHTNPGAAQSVTTDICGTVYWESGDTVRRQTADGAQSGDVTTAPGFQYTPNLRWGYGVGGFKAEHLYALSRGDLWEFHVGVPGKKHISEQ